MSSTLALKLVSSKEPPLLPKPVKSKRSTPIPSVFSARLMFRAALICLEQVKQCANTAYIFGFGPGGRSNSALSGLSDPLLISIRFIRIRRSKGYFMTARNAKKEGKLKLLRFIEPIKKRFQLLGV